MSRTDCEAVCLTCQQHQVSLLQRVSSVLSDVDGTVLTQNATGHATKEARNAQGFQSLSVTQVKMLGESEIANSTECFSSLLPVLLPS